MCDSLLNYCPSQRTYAVNTCDENNVVALAACPKRNQSGFTLIELILVMTVVALLSVMGSQFMAGAVESYRESSNDAKLLNHGRAVIEQISRRLRGSLPNSIRVSASGRCIEFLPLLAGAFYEDTLALSGDSFQNSVIATSAFGLSNTNARYAAVAPLASAELYQPLTVPSVIAAVVNPGIGTHSAIGLQGPHQFIRHSPSQRLYIAGDPMRFCVNGLNELRLHEGYGLPATVLNDTAPNTGTLLAEDIQLQTETAFTLSLASLERNNIVAIALPLVRDNKRLLLEHQVQIRNVP